MWVSSKKKNSILLGIPSTECVFNNLQTRATVFDDEICLEFQASRFATVVRARHGTARYYDLWPGFSWRREAAFREKVVDLARLQVQ